MFMFEKAVVGSRRYWMWVLALGAVIGAALDAWMMVPGWVRGKTMPEDLGVQLSHMVDHIDHVCQLAGNARHSGIGTDLVVDQRFDLMQLLRRHRLARRPYHQPP